MNYWIYISVVHIRLPDTYWEIIDHNLDHVAWMMPAHQLYLIFPEYVVYEGLSDDFDDGKTSGLRLSLRK